MLTSLLQRLNNQSQDLVGTRLFDEDTFYPAFLKDLNECGAEVLIESPFVTSKRISLFLPVLKRLKAKGVKIAVNTRDPYE